MDINSVVLGFWMGGGLTLLIVFFVDREQQKKGK